MTQSSSATDKFRLLPQLADHTSLKLNVFKLFSLYPITMDFSRYNNKLPGKTLPGHWLIIVLLLLFTISGCETRPTRGPETIDQSVAGRKAATTEDKLLEVRRLLDLAEESENVDQQLGYRLQATGLLIDIGDLESAHRQLEFIHTKSTDDKTILAEIAIQETRVAIAEKQAVKAGELLNTIKPISRQQQLDYYWLKADLDQLNGHYMSSVDRRTQLESYLDTDELKQKNHLKIWSALTSMPTSELSQQTSSKPTVNGWLDLARITRKNQRDPVQLENSLLDWGTQYPQHPANEGFIADLLDTFRKDSREHRQIAVILPLSGELSVVANTIKNGMLSAYYDDKNPSPPELRFYDSGSNDNQFNQLYQQAVKDGADIILGPLDKSLVSYLARQPALDLPVLSLNYAETDEINNANLFQFGLSPEDEAEQMAELAIAQNRKHAAIFYPDSEWGRRVRLAFNRHYSALGGTIETEADYVTDSNDFRLPIRKLFNLDKSTIRQNRVENIIGERVQGEPYRRQDLDMIFLAATSRSARSIMPSFKFHHAGDLQVYATSHVYSGIINSELDRDLNGLVFCDMPWVLDNNTALKTEFEQNWPEQQAYTRLFALGVDAYHLTSNIDYLSTFTDASYPGLTGDISLGINDRIKRKLLWATFVSGKPVVITPEQVITSPGS